jgi:mono/diheme cytochrome c family protein
MAASAVAWAIAAAGAGVSAQAVRSVNDGVYTEAQADRGKQIFEGTCTACHDTARFTGADFVAGWAGKPVASLFEAVQTMPEDNPGSLTAQQYGDILAFFLRLNQFPAGSDDLKGDAEALRTITMEARKP